MGTIATILAGFVLAGAATAGVVVTQSSGPSGSAPTSQTTDVTSVYDVGQ